MQSWQKKVVIHVLGRPYPKGSGRAIVLPKINRAVIVPGASDAGKKRLRDWAAAVRKAAQEIMQGQEHPIFQDEPMLVGIVFRMLRPANHYGARGLRPSAPPFPAKKPDLDKLVRSTLDPLSGTVYDDDSRIVDLRVRKVWAPLGEEGATIMIASLK